MLILFRKITVHFYLKYCYISNVKNFLTFILVLFFASALLAEFRMERVICTTKKTSNCGAYIYNSKTGEVYFCDSEKCQEVDTPIEIFIEEEIGEEIEESKGSLIPKKPKKKESKIPKNLKRKNQKFQKNLKRKNQKFQK